MHYKTSRWLFICCGFLSIQLWADNGHYVSLQTQSGHRQPFLLFKKEPAVATLLLFVGGNGYLDLGQDGRIKQLQNNFLIRSIGLLLEQGFQVAVYEAPSHKANTLGLSGGYRSSRRHSQDIVAVVDYLSDQGSIWLVGTSRGATSAANSAIYLGDKISGVVLTAPLTVNNKKGSQVTTLALNKITVPVFIGVHEQDKCRVTPPQGAYSVQQALVKSPVVELVAFDQPVLPTRGRECGGRSAHGFWGIERDVIESITRFIKQSVD